jgi:signal transduction histidine kinase
MTSGADDYLMKPFNAGELIDAINSRMARLNKSQGQFTRLQAQLLRNVCDQLDQPDDVLEEVMESLVERVHRIIDDDTAAYYANSDAPFDLNRLTGQLTLLAKLNSTALGHDSLLNNGAIVIVRDLWMQALTDARNIVGDIDQVNILTDENNLDAAVVGNSNALIAAFTEIIINAFQHSTFNGVITIAQWATRDHAWFSVTDSGKGMTQAHVRMLLANDNFEKGLGLTLAKRIAEAHGGDLRIDSAPNQGTIVAIRLPLAEVDIAVRG